MSALRNKNLRIGERLPQIFGGRNIRSYPDYKPSRIKNYPSEPPVSGYNAWYDPSDLSTVTVSSAGLMTNLADKTGSFNSTSMVEAWLVQVPQVFSGRPCIWFAGGTTTQGINTNAPMSDITCSAFVVARAYTITGIFPAMLGPSADAGLEFRVNSSAGDAKLTVLSSDTAQIGDNDANLVTLGTPFVAGMVMSATDVTIYNNLNSETDAHSVTLTAGRTLVIGRAPFVNANADRWAGWIGEIVMYDTTLSSGAAISVIGYLMSKWGIS